MASSDKSRSLGIIFLSLTILLFSTFEVTSKFLSPHMSPLQITFSRFLIGGIVLLPFALIRLKRRRITLTGKDILACGILGFVNICVSMGFIQAGLVYADASTSAVLFSVNPLFVVLFAKPLLGEKITAGKTAGIILGITGVVVLFAGTGARKTSSAFGLSLILSSAVTFALYTVLGKKIINSRIDSLTVTTVSFLTGSALLAPALPALGVPFIPDARTVLPELLYMSVAVTGLAYVLYFEGLSRLEAGAGSMLYFAKPAFASILALTLLNEHPGMNLLFGIVIIAGGIFVSQLQFNKSNRS
jgi:drug/metabolite transporter (DMT)-like permease